LGDFACRADKDIFQIYATIFTVPTILLHRLFQVTLDKQFRRESNGNPVAIANAG
jgi:hypothetical protein